MPGTSASSWLTGLALCCCFLSGRSSSAIRLVELGQLGCPERPASVLLPWPARASVGRHGFEQCRQLADGLGCDHAELGGVPAHGVDQLRSAAGPAARAPKARSPRPAATADLTGTLGMSGRAAASLIASPRRCGRSCRAEQTASRIAAGSAAPCGPMRRQPAAPMVRAAARLQSHMRRRQLGEERLHLGPLHVAAQDGLLRRGPRHASVNTALDVSEANALKVHADGPSGSMVTVQPWHEMPQGRPPQHGPEQRQQ